MNIFKQPIGITFPVNYAKMKHIPPTNDYLNKLIPTRLELPPVNGMFMTNYHKNEHHIFPHVYWDVYINPICEILGLKHTPEKFKLCKYYSEDAKTDLSFHDPIAPKHNAFTINYIGDDGKMHISHNLRNISNVHTELTNYHRLFIGAHTCGYIENKYATSNEKLLLACDSMFIPVIPIIANYCKSIMFVDNRTRQDFISKYIHGHSFTKCIIAKLHNHMFAELIRSTFR